MTRYVRCVVCGDPHPTALYKERFIRLRDENGKLRPVCHGCFDSPIENVFPLEERARRIAQKPPQG